MPIPSGRRLALAGAVMLLWSASAAHASDVIGSPFGSSFGYVPRVPVSAFARPAGWFDPSRLGISTSVSVGSGLGGKSEGLQVTSLSYHFGAPLWMNVSVGNAWGASQAANGNSLFLSGLDVGYRPFQMLQIQIHYRDVRSPLQYSSDPFYYRPGW